jgi:hypothetical protein
MKYIYIALSILLLTACGADENKEGNSITPESSEIGDTIVAAEEVMDAIILEELPEGQMYEEDFLALFKYDFEHAYDFGWRFIESNYDEIEVESEVEKTAYDQEHDLFKITSLHIVEDDGEKNIRPIGFEGYGHSQKWINGNRLLVTYNQGEISEEFYFYYVDSNYMILKEGYLASNGGDEGTWYYSYGEFSKDNSVYEMTKVEGEALDTFDINTTIINFD